MLFQNWAAFFQFLLGQSLIWPFRFLRLINGLHHVLVFPLRMHQTADLGTPRISVIFLFCLFVSQLKECHWTHVVGLQEQLPNVNAPHLTSFTCFSDDELSRGKLHAAHNIAFRVNCPVTFGPFDLYTLKLQLRTLYGRILNPLHKLLLVFWLNPPDRTVNTVKFVGPLACTCLLSVSH